jgi:hypothetical protein
MSARTGLTTQDIVNNEVKRFFRDSSEQAPWRTQGTHKNSPMPPQRANSEPQPPRPKRPCVIPPDSVQKPQPGPRQAGHTASPADRRPPAELPADPTSTPKGPQPRQRSDAGTSRSGSSGPSHSALGLQPSNGQSQHPATTRMATPPSVVSANSQLSQEFAHRLSVQASRQLPHPAAHMQRDQSASQSRGGQLAEGLNNQLNNRVGHHQHPSSYLHSIAARGQSVQGANGHRGFGQLQFSSPEANTQASGPGVHPDTSHSIQHPPSNAQGVSFQQYGQPVQQYCPPGQQHHVFGQQPGPSNQQHIVNGQHYGPPGQQGPPIQQHSGFGQQHSQQHGVSGQLQQMPPSHPQHSAQNCSKDNLAVPGPGSRSLKRSSDHFTDSAPKFAKPDPSHWVNHLPVIRTIKPGELGVAVPQYVEKYKNDAVLGCDCDFYVVMSSKCGHAHSAHRIICGLMKDTEFNPNYGAQTRMCEKKKLQPTIPGLVIDEDCNFCRGRPHTKTVDTQMSNT